MKKVLFFALLIGLTFYAVPSLAAEYYVDSDTSTGDNMDCTQALPCYSLGWVASNLLSGGDTIYLKGEMDFPAGGHILNNFVSGTADQYTTITSWPGEDPAVFDGLVGGNDDFFNISNASYIKIDNLIFKDNLNFGMQVDNCESVEISRIDVSDGFREAFYIAHSSNVMIANNILSEHDTSSTMWLDNNENVYVMNNTFYNNLDIIRTTSIVNDSKNSFFNNIVYAQGGGQAGLIDMTGVTDYFDSLAADNNIYYVSGNIFSHNGGNYTLAQWQNIHGQDAASLEEDPEFTSIVPGSEDFSLQSTSPARDAGTTIATVVNDYLGVSRPKGAGYDIGAYEFFIELGVPTNLSAIKYVKKAELSWDEVTDAESYTLQYSNSKDFKVSTEIITTANSYTLTDLKHGGRYYWAVNAVSGDFFSDYSDTKRLITYLKTKSKAKKTSVLKATHQDIAYDLNSSREVISRLLKQLEKEGRIGLGRNKIDVTNL